MQPPNKSPNSDLSPDWPAYDAAHIWHPYSSIINPPPMIPVASAQGVYLQLENGEQLIDGMASWWAVIHGYNHPRLNAAIENQLKSMAHVMFGGLTHQPATDLAKTLVDLTAEPLQYVFFADSGSVSVEVALKMALQYWVTQKRPEKHRLLSFRNAYHGDTFGAMSVCDPVNGMHSIFEHMLPKHLFAAPPGETPSDQDTQDAPQSIEHLLEQHHHEIAAVILEPLVQGAGGMRFYSPEYLRKVRQLCDQHDVLLILDEIATGFGRTGTLFAYEQADITPDILCLGKALTGGYMTLAATLTTEKIAQTISAKGEGLLMHGPTFMANPMACSVANESIKLLLESPWQNRVKQIEKQLLSELSACKSLPLVKDVRVKGAIGVIELSQPVDIRWMQPKFVELGVWIRPFNHLVYIMPPYVIQANELSRLTAAMYSVVQAFGDKIQ